MRRRCGLCGILGIGFHFPLPQKGGLPWCRLNVFFFYLISTEVNLYPTWDIVLCWHWLEVGYFAQMALPVQKATVTCTQRSAGLSDVKMGFRVGMNAQLLYGRASHVTSSDPVGILYAAGGAVGVSEMTQSARLIGYLPPPAPGTG